jgi:hypothetical protein
MVPVLVSCHLNSRLLNTDVFCTREAPTTVCSLGYIDFATARERGAPRARRGRRAAGRARAQCCDARGVGRVRAN